MSLRLKLHSFWIRSAIAALSLLLAWGISGCSDKGKPGSGSGKSGSGSSLPPEERIRDGLSDEWRLDHPECTHAKKVTSPDPGSPEEVVLNVYRAALAPDTEEAFQQFYAQLDDTKYSEEEARRHFWGRLREHVDKYVEGPDDPTYILCRIAKKTGREDYVKLFVLSKVKTKSNPPYGMVQRGNRWVIEFFNY